MIRVFALIVLTMITGAMAAPPISFKSRMEANDKVVSDTIRGLNEHLDGHDKLPERFKSVDWRTVNNQERSKRRSDIASEINIKSSKGGVFRFQCDFFDDDIRLDIVAVSLPWHREQDHPSRADVVVKLKRYLIAWLKTHNSSADEQKQILEAFDEVAPLLKQTTGMKQLEVGKSRISFYGDDKAVQWTFWIHSERHPPFPG